jgi:hypothetical protein
MARTIHKTEQPVILEGYQAVLKPSKFGYSLAALVGEDMIDALEADREESLQWAQSKLKNPKRSTLKPEPWEEVSEGQYKVKFSWNEEARPPVVDTEGTHITDEDTPLNHTFSVMELRTEQALNWLVYNWCLSMQELV